MVVKSELRYQYLAGICVNILTISYGGLCGWPSASFLELQAEDSPLATGPLSNDDAGWVGAMLCLGGMLGTLFVTWCADKLGRKKCLLMLAVPSLLAWLVIPFAQTPMHLCLSRILGGFAGGGAFTIIPIYTTELAEDSVRGALGTILVLTFNFGILLAFILGNFYNYVTVAWTLSVFSLLFLICFSFLPETPQHLMNTNKVQEAEKSLRYYRNIRCATKELPEKFLSELEKLKGDDKQEDEAENNAIVWQDLSNPVACKAMFIGMGLMALLNFCGCFAMLNYTAGIFKESGSSFSPKVAAIFVGAIQLLGSYIATVLVERAGRKLLLLISSIGIGLGHACFGSYSYLSYLGYDTSTYAWLPVASFSFTLFISCLGVMSLPYLVLSEIMPPKIRHVGSMTCMMFMWIIGFALLKNLPLMGEMLGMHGMVLVFGCCSFAGAAFIALFLPETKGKSIETILSLL